LKDRDKHGIGGESHWERSYYSAPVVARRHYNGVTIGYIVGWKHRYCNMVRNIRAGLIFPNVIAAQRFKKNMESKRIFCHVEHEIIED